jgi:hypothetical protein
MTPGSKADIVYNNRADAEHRVVAQSRMTRDGGGSRYPGVVADGRAVAEIDEAPDLR